MAEIEDTYRVLLVSSSDRFNDALAQLMPESIYPQVAVARSVSAAKRLLMEQDFDLVLVNGPLPDDLGMRFARDASAGTSAGVVLIVGAELCEEISDKMAAQGLAVLPKPASAREVELSINLGLPNSQSSPTVNYGYFFVESLFQSLRIERFLDRHIDDPVQSRSLASALRKLVIREFFGPLANPEPNPVPELLFAGQEAEREPLLAELQPLVEMQEDLQKLFPESVMLLRVAFIGVGPVAGLGEVWEVLREIVGAYLYDRDHVIFAV